MNKWNNNPKQGAKATVRGFALYHDVVATVGFSNDFPDLCQIAFASPQSDTAAVYREADDSSGPLGSFYQVGSGTVSDLADSAKDWNARATEDGGLTYGY